MALNVKICPAHTCAIVPINGSVFIAPNRTTYAKAIAWPFADMVLVQCLMGKGNAPANKDGPKMTTGVAPVMSTSVLMVPTLVQEIPLYVASILKADSGAVPVLKATPVMAFSAKMSMNV